MNNKIKVGKNRKKNIKTKPLNLWYGNIQLNFCCFM